MIAQFQLLLHLHKQLFKISRSNASEKIAAELTEKETASYNNY